ncbi:hypothetical protein ES703_103305 [subsurface metagenome]
MVVDAVDHFLPIRFKLLRPTWKVLVNPRLVEWVGNGNHNGGISARWVLGLIVLGLDLKALVPNS